ncbi:hypothetical protein [Rhizobium sp. WYJ-E13]|uniref:hypothetical protein n=1 Tax=Rhizobium sp. WYJ-E13 TaxID=2849093 RepID=UPI001C1EAC1C|nr:hypothetical protein [Rhizobium sp. WYJ-E13]QWW71214.1 hypothetical protein KQ933_31165 [Rhizobium sp. WYJ-E13]
MHLVWTTRRCQAASHRPQTWRGATVAYHGLSLQLHFATLHATTNLSQRLSSPVAGRTTIARHVSHHHASRSRTEQTLARIVSSDMVTHRHLLSVRQMTMLRHRDAMLPAAERHGRDESAAGALRVRVGEPMPTIFRTVRRQHGVAQASAPVSQIAARSAAPAILVHRHAGLGATPLQPGKTGGAANSLAQTVARRAPDLVWRVDSVTPTSGGTAENPVRAMPMPSASTGTAWSARGAATPSPPRIDAAVIDRIAEDVISKVERRMRIERERRGL